MRQSTTPAVMRALRWKGRRDIAVVEVAVPSTRSGELLIAVEACGVCGTDVDEYLNGPVFVALDSHAVEGGRTLGHEFAGRVIGAASGLENRIGELVAVSPDYPCGDCSDCALVDGVCSRPAALGLTHDGGLAELCSVPAHATVTLPSHISPAAGAMVEPLAIALHGLRAVGVHDGDRVVIIGGGAVGVLAGLAAKAKGVTDVVIVEPSETRRAVAASAGLTTMAAFSPEADTASLVLECSGAQSGLDTAVAACGQRGRLGLIGIHGEKRQVDVARLVSEEISVFGVLSYDFDADFLLAAHLIAEGAVDPTPLLGAVISLEDAPEQFARLAAGQMDIVKLIVDPRPDGSRNA